MRCPRCGGTLQGVEELYGTIYTCEPCGVQIIDYKHKVVTCIRLVLEVLDEIARLVSYFNEEHNASVKNFYLYKSRARGDCREDSDIDIWMEVHPFTDAEVLNSKLIESPLSWYEHEGKRVVWDFKFGVGAPPGAHYDNQTLRKLRATLSSS